MKKGSQVIDRFAGLDVHAATIAVAVAERGEARLDLWHDSQPNRVDPEAGEEAERRRRFGQPCYEAGPTGYVLYRLLTRIGISCQVIAPTLVPVKAGDRIKTDRRDALRLAQSFRAGDLTPVWVPDAAHEALRDLVRARESAKQDQLRARHRLGKFLLRHGHRPDAKMMPWTQKHMDWIKGSVRFEQPASNGLWKIISTRWNTAALRITRLEASIDKAVETAPESMKQVIEALQALRGIAKVSAVTIVAEADSCPDSQRALQGRIRRAWGHY